MIRVDHIGLPAHARRDAAAFLASVFGLDAQTSDEGPFAPLSISREFTIVFYESDQVQSMHVAFLVDDAAFDATLGRLKSQRVAYGSQPNDPKNGRIDHPLSDRGLFFRTPDGHLFELMASSSNTT